MSSDRPSPGNSFASTTEIDQDIQTGFKIVGIVVVFLIFLAVMRVLCIVMVDVSVLREYGSLLRLSSELRRIFCAWHPRTQPQGETTDVGATTNVNNSETTLDDILCGLNQQQKQELLSSILPTKVACEEDFQNWRTTGMDIRHDLKEASNSEPNKHNNNNNSEIVCSICINSIEIGNHVVDLTSCNHTFHKNCLSQWLSTHTRDCPYCRVEIITQEMIDQAYHLRRNREA